MPIDFYEVSKYELNSHYTVLLKLYSLTGENSEDSVVEENEEMDWEYSDPELIAAINQTRNEVLIRDEDKESSLVKKFSSKPKSETQGRKTIVLDTNVLIADLAKIEELVMEKMEICFYIPWTVLVELDALKLKPTTKDRARKAIRYLGLIVDEDNSSCADFAFQSAKEEKGAGQKFEAVCADDRILQACLQIKDER